MIAAQLLAPASLLGGWVLYLPILLWALWRAPWVELFSDLRRQHLLFGTVLVLFLLWLLRRDFPSGVSFHFIGMTAVVLLLDWPLAILAGFMAQLGLLLLGRQELIALGVNGLLLVGLPVLLTQGCARWVERFQPRNLFVFIFCAGFFPAALVAALCSVSGWLLLCWGGVYALPAADPEDFAAYLLLVMFPEAFINGTFISALVVFYPDWLETFNRSRYLQAPWKDEGRPRL
ncbi:energy-coupling factor ABC transporter permease [Pseudomonas sp. N040]|uniref:energy-coupling factor ABC transporter permease n=1 Tax=Pseudomonas sp. N040 TaxID=2785325 RepID=UPI0018A306E8|nr:energy-coupling factor ABC transporter permease [Pseudomonas sp. N040]MBF7730260.1 energy-coupling factor ABC transporter permease [Pseudomonas sp. N040]MBW7013902.1 energy-coupling factor ABC transporter permease [Pseudomonas sp. N040]